MSDISSLSDLLGQITDEGNDLSGIGGTNLRLRKGSREIFAVEPGVTGAIDVPEIMSLSRIIVRDQGGMTVAQGTILMEGERIGTVTKGDDGEDIFTPLPQYEALPLANWRRLVHIVNFEFMRPGTEAIEQLTELGDRAGFTQYEPGPRAVRVPEAERSSTTVYDKQAPGRSVADRLHTGIKLDGFVLVPDPRTGVLTTTYVNRDEQEVTRAGFTNFVDAGVSAMFALIQAQKTGDQSAINEAFRNLNLLTGRSPETQYPLRPTLGYLTPTPAEGSDPVEIDMFPAREGDESQSVPATPANTPDPDGSQADEVETPFGDD